MEDLRLFAAKKSADLQVSAVVEGEPSALREKNWRRERIPAVDVEGEPSTSPGRWGLCGTRDVFFTAQKMRTSGVLVGMVAVGMPRPILEFCDVPFS